MNHSDPEFQNIARIAWRLFARLKEAASQVLREWEKFSLQENRLNEHKQTAAGAAWHGHYTEAVLARKIDQLRTMHRAGPRALLKEARAAFDQVRGLIPFGQLHKLLPRPVIQSLDQIDYDHHIAQICLAIVEAEEALRRYAGPAPDNWQAPSEAPLLFDEEEIYAIEGEVQVLVKEVEILLKEREKEREEQAEAKRKAEAEEATRKTEREETQQELDQKARPDAMQALVPSQHHAEEAPVAQPDKGPRGRPSTYVEIDGSAVKKLRGERSQKLFAELLGISEDTVQRAEKGFAREAVIEMLCTFARRENHPLTAESFQKHSTAKNRKE